MTNQKKNEKAKPRAKAKHITKAALRRAIDSHLLNSGFSTDGNAYFIEKDLSKHYNAAEPPFLP